MIKFLLRRSFTNEQFGNRFVYIIVIIEIQYCAGIKSIIHITRNLISAYKLMYNKQHGMNLGEYMGVLVRGEGEGEGERGTCTLARI
jgi:hypothetical protein